MNDDPLGGCASWLIAIVLVAVLFFGIRECRKTPEQKQADEAAHQAEVAAQAQKEAAERTAYLNSLTTEERSAQVRADAFGPITVWTDPDTGCQYLIRDGYREVAVAARYSSDGVTVSGCNAAAKK